MNEEGTPTFGSLFSGIGGIDLGLEWAGWKCKWQVENDPYCIRILERHWPNVRRYGDIRTVHAPPFVDLICGGFPCQPVSEAGKRKAQADERWLWPEFANIVREIRPRTILVENVPGLLTVNQGTAMGDILGDLAELGYDTRWESISAAAFGAPHLRRRVFIVAYSTSNGCDSNRIAQRSETDTYHEKRESTEIIARWEDIEPYSGKSSRWATKPRMGRVANGIPHRVDRIRTLGNAVVPQIAEYIGRQISPHYNMKAGIYTYRHKS